MDSRSVRQALFLVLVVLQLPTVASSGGDAIGPQFQVNSLTEDFQWFSDVAVASNGNFVVVWATYHGLEETEGVSRDIRGQRFAFDGSPLGTEFQINTYSTSAQSDPAVADGANGAFVAVWRSLGSFGSDTDSASIQGQRYAADGAPLGGQFQVNTNTTGNQGSPGIAADADGNFVLLFEQHPGSALRLRWSPRRR